VAILERVAAPPAIRPGDEPTVGRAGPAAPARVPPSATRGPLPRRASPLLAVCGLGGGAGTSALGYLIARYAVANALGHALVCDTGGPGGGLAAYARTWSARSLAELADDLAAGIPVTGGLYAVDAAASRRPHELRVIATGPRRAGGMHVAALSALLDMATSAGVHAVTVIDCGAGRHEAARTVLRHASHVAWVLPASRDGVRHAEPALAALGDCVRGRELLVAFHDRAEPAELMALRALADGRRAPLVLVPDLGDPLHRPARALERAAVALQAIVGALAR
jgi:hypothetical protein